jgi:hypothetical protein
MRRLITAVIVAGLLLTIPATVLGQDDTIDTTSGAGYINAALPDYPDPLVTTMLSGGPVDASTLSAGCVGNIFNVPDAQIELTSRLPLFRVYFTAAETSMDTTLVVQLPDGSFVCNDDFQGSNPLVEIGEPQQGTYFVWVGTFGSTNDFFPGYLVITAGDSMPGALVQPLLGVGGTTPIEAQPTPVPTLAPTATVFDPLADIAPTLTSVASTANAMLDSVAPTLTAAANLINNTTNTIPTIAAPTPDPGLLGSTTTLSAGFTPDPTTVELTAGGSVDASTLGSDCRGLIDVAPNHIVMYSGGGSLLRLFFNSEGDSTLVVLKPDGSYVCNDDFPGTLDPLVDIVNPGAGPYSIWVGTYQPGQELPGTLSITASADNDPTTSGK